MLQTQWRASLNSNEELLCHGDQVLVDGGQPHVHDVVALAVADERHPGLGRRVEAGRAEWESRVGGWLTPQPTTTFPQIFFKTKLPC